MVREEDLEGIRRATRTLPPPPAPGRAAGQRAQPLLRVWVGSEFSLPFTRLHCKLRTDYLCLPLRCADSWRGSQHTRPGRLTERPAQARHSTHFCAADGNHILQPSPAYSSSQREPGPGAPSCPHLGGPASRVTLVHVCLHLLP